MQHIWGDVAYEGDNVWGAHPLGGWNVTLVPEDQVEEGNVEIVQPGNIDLGFLDEWVGVPAAFPAQIRRRRQQGGRRARRKTNKAKSKVKRSKGGLRTKRMSHKSRLRVKRS